MSFWYCNRYKRACQCTSHSFLHELGERTPLTIFYLLVPFLLPGALGVKKGQTYFKIGPKCTVV